MIKIEIKTADIKLDQFLKYANVINSGGEAKHCIQQGLVKVNGEIQTKRSLKLQINDLVEFNGQLYKVINNQN